MDEMRQLCLEIFHTDGNISICSATEYNGSYIENIRLHKKP